MLLPVSLVRLTRISTGGMLAAILAMACWGIAAESRAESTLPTVDGAIRLDLSPRICTLSANDKQ